MVRARWMSVGVCVMTLGVGCGEEKEDPPPPNEPAVIAGRVICKETPNGRYRLDSIEVVVRDLDGVEDLREPRMRLVATALELTKTPRPWTGSDDPEEECMRDADEGAARACDQVFSWARTSSSAQIDCGTDGRVLDLVFEIKDVEGFSAQAFIPSTPG